MYPVSFVSSSLGDNTDPDQPSTEELTTGASTMNEGALKGKQYM